mmetsp:Transcript_93321/g.290996  ORF Transcript_93321/g.290996 Transcript_93321/m.290996 type:complete len:202 (-) Transcript_93321:201-806(-)
MMARISPKPCETELNTSSSTRFPDRRTRTPLALAAWVMLLHMSKDMKLFWMSSSFSMCAEVFSKRSTMILPPSSPKKQDRMRTSRRLRDLPTAEATRHTLSRSTSWLERSKSSKPQLGCCSRCDTSSRPAGPKEQPERSKCRRPRSLAPWPSSSSITNARSSRSPKGSEPEGRGVRRSLPSCRLTRASAEGFTCMLLQTWR